MTSCDARGAPPSWAVIEWYRGHARDLPWRAPGTTPYGVLVSEVMSQQTPVARVVPAWGRWMDCWPDPAALAEARTAEVLRMWGALGYPRRALRLIDCARAVVERYGGRLPCDLEALRALPGIGEYTAGAVLAFGFGRRALALDTNVRRVLARAVGGRALPPPALARAERERAEALLPEADGEAAEAAWREAVEARSSLRARCDAVEASCRALSRAVTALGAATGDAAALVEVSALASGSGSNRRAIPLASWVLLERFAEVLVFANQRLEHMSGGRYALVRVDDEKQAARRRGLGLGVVDRLGGEATRDPRTLSGGETFYVSLALALALADVVTTESGGIAMETLFVDEGFGSLDPEALQDVLAELSRLRAGGRTVGIVSHVEELRRQIPDQIRVVRDDRGSRLRTIGG